MRDSFKCKKKYGNKEGNNKDYRHESRGSQELAAADKALSVEEIAKAAQISANEVLVGLGWLFKEGKVAGQEDNKVVLA